MFTTLLLCVLVEAQVQADRDVIVAEHEVGRVRLTLSQLEADGTNLRLTYEVENRSDHDIWLCEAVNRSRDFEVCLARDRGILTVRRRLDVPTTNLFYVPPSGTYIRLLPGQSRAESLRLSLPVRDSPLFCNGEFPLRDIVITDKLAIEIGFYDHDVAAMVLDALARAERVPKSTGRPDILFWLGGSLLFTISNECIRDRDQVVEVSYNGQSIDPEQVLRVVAEGVKVPYIGPPGPQDWVAPPKPPDLTNCTRVVVTYQPSMLDYFFPSTGQQSLLNSEEREYLQRQKSIIVDDSEHIEAFRKDISRGRSSAIALAGSATSVACYHNDDMLTSFTIYGGQRLVTEDGQQFKYVDCIESLRAITEPVKAFELRARCAANLKNLWYRLRLYYRSDKSRLVGSSVIPKYPSADKWADDIVAVYKRLLSQQELLKPFRCPVTEDAQSHYAMNPDCTYGSPPDTVLLFETKDGWNQHGGPELFRFDNHEPRGGLVLLNDGTVKFIRTEEELNQLRWK